MSGNKYEWNSKNVDDILGRLVPKEQEEILSKKRARELFDEKILEKIEVGTIGGLKKIHKYLFQDVFKQFFVKQYT